MSNINIKEIKSFCHTVFSDTLRKTQRENLGRAVSALVTGRDAHLSSVARDFEGAASFKYRLKRFDRFIGNHWVQTWECFESLVPVILKLANRVSGYLPVLVDHTDIGKNLRVCYAAVLFKRRALPLIFFVFNKRKIRHSQNKLEEMLLWRLKQLTPARLRLVIVADRGFGRVSLFRFIELEMKWKFVIRAKGTVTIAGNNYTGLLKDAPPVFWRENVCYHKTAQHELSLVTCVEGTNDPWFLATNLTNAVLVKDIYEKRMRIEELFRDQKWHTKGGEVEIQNPIVGAPNDIPQFFVLVLTSVQTFDKFVALNLYQEDKYRPECVCWLVTRKTLSVPDQCSQIIVFGED